MISDILTMIERLGGDMFKNMKIQVENNLDEIVTELERLGYETDDGFVDGVDNFVHTYRNGTYDFFMSNQLWGELTTLAELKEM